MTINEIVCCIEGYRTKQVEQYRHTRILMFTMVKMWGDKGPLSPEELWPLPGDEEQESEDDKIRDIFESLRKAENHE